MNPDLLNYSNDIYYTSLQICITILVAIMCSIALSPIIVEDRTNEIWTVPRTISLFCPFQVHLVYNNNRGLSLVLENQFVFL